MNTIYVYRALVELGDVLYTEQFRGTRAEINSKIESIKRCRGKIVRESLDEYSSCINNTPASSIAWESVEHPPPTKKTE